jgi:hypothetical protein
VLVTASYCPFGFMRDSVACLTIAVPSLHRYLSADVDRWQHETLSLEDSSMAQRGLQRHYLIYPFHESREV